MNQTSADLTALYVYCFTEADGSGPAHAEGLDGAEVASLEAKDLRAYAHWCEPRPYASEDADVVKRWVAEHHRVVSEVWRQADAVLPATFNTIVQGGEDGDASAHLENWLEQESPRLKDQLRLLAGRSEYGIQTFWDSASYEREIADTQRRLESERESNRPSSRGLAYLHQQRLKRGLHEQITSRARDLFKTCYEPVVRCSDRVRVEEAKSASSDSPALMNVSCLATSEQFRRLSVELEALETKEGVCVRVVGPFPPYSFV